MADRKAFKFADQHGDVKPGELQIRKMKTMVASMDTDGDGYLEFEDFELMVKRYIELGKIDGARAKQALQQFKVIWDAGFAPDAVNGKLTGEQLAAAFLRRGRDMVIALASICYSFIFDIVDNEKRGFIDKHQYHLMHQMQNTQCDEATTEASFKIIDVNGNGQISYMEFIQAGIDYYTSNDPNSPYNLLYGPLHPL